MLIERTEKPNIRDDKRGDFTRFLIGWMHSHLKMKHQPEPQIEGDGRRGTGTQDQGLGPVTSSETPGYMHP